MAVIVMGFQAKYFFTRLNFKVMLIQWDFAIVALILILNDMRFSVQSSTHPLPGINSVRLQKFGRRLSLRKALEKRYDRLLTPLICSNYQVECQKTTKKADLLQNRKIFFCFLYRIENKIKNKGGREKFMWRKEKYGRKKPIRFVFSKRSIYISSHGIAVHGGEFKA